MKYLKTYESRQIEYELIDQLDTEEIEEFYYNNFVDNDFKDLLNYTDMSILWNCVDNDNFRKDFIDSETDYYLDDWGNVNFSDNIMIDYLDKIEGTDIPKEDLKKLDEESIKGLIKNKETFIRYYLDETVDHSAYEIILEQGVSSDELDQPSFFISNEYNIQNYIDQEDIVDDIMNQTDFDYMRRTLIDVIDDYSSLQELIISKDPGPNTRTFIEDMGFQLMDEPKYQRYYLEELNKVFKGDLVKIWDSVKKHLTPYAELDQDLAKEFELDSFIEADKFNF